MMNGRRRLGSRIDLVKFRQFVTADGVVSLYCRFLSLSAKTERGRIGPIEMLGRFDGCRRFPMRPHCSPSMCWRKMPGAAVHSAGWIASNGNPLSRRASGKANYAELWKDAVC